MAAAAAAAEPDLCHSSVPMKATSQGSLFRRDVITRRQQQPITDASRSPATLQPSSLSLLYPRPRRRRILSSEPRERERERIDYPTVRRQSQGIAEWAQGLLNPGQPTSSSG